LSFGELKLKLIIEELAARGDELSETLEIYDDDPVISAYLKNRAELMAPLWSTAKNWDTSLLRAEWDDQIGKLQRLGLYQAELGEANVHIHVEE
jgi:hypothetical protein